MLRTPQHLQFLGNPDYPKRCTPKGKVASPYALQYWYIWINTVNKIKYSLYCVRKGGSSSTNPVQLCVYPQLYTDNGTELIYLTTQRSCIVSKLSLSTFLKRIVQLFLQRSICCINTTFIIICFNGTFWCVFFSLQCWMWAISQSVQGSVANVWNLLPDSSLEWSFPVYGPAFLEVLS